MIGNSRRGGGDPGLRPGAQWNGRFITLGQLPVQDERFARAYWSAAFSDSSSTASPVSTSSVVMERGGM